MFCHFRDQVPIVFLDGSFLRLHWGFLSLRLNFREISIGNIFQWAGLLARCSKPLKEVLLQFQKLALSLPLPDGFLPGIQILIPDHSPPISPLLPTIIKDLFPTK
jgi:hypothetical protein